MARQPAPDVCSSDVERVVRRDFAAGQVLKVLAMLSEYGKEKWQREPDRVRLAVLKLAAGDIEQLGQHIEIAKRDYRDVLAAAEYPGYSKDMLRIPDLPQEEQQRIIDADWGQYQEWLAR